MCVYTINTTWFDECFLFHVIAGRHYFYTNLSLSRYLVQPLLLRSLKQVFWKKSAFYIRYIHNFFVYSVFYSFTVWMFHIFLCKSNFSNIKTQKLPRIMFFWKSYLNVYDAISLFKNKWEHRYLIPSIKNDYPKQMF